LQDEDTPILDRVVSAESMVLPTTLIITECWSFYYSHHVTRNACSYWHPYHYYWHWRASSIPCLI